jgi:hypothetical protein
MTISDDSRDYGKFADGATYNPERHTRTVSSSGSSFGSGASMQEGSTLKVIRLTELQACVKKIKKIGPKLLEKTTYMAVLLICMMYNK